MSLSLDLDLDKTKARKVRNVLKPSYEHVLGIFHRAKLMVTEECRIFNMCSYQMVQSFIVIN